jgi:ATP-dependent RNA helicase UAP56/SUB2
MSTEQDLPDYDYVEDNKDEAGGAGADKHRSIPTGGLAQTTTSFKDMLLKPELNRAIAECGFEHPSEVQQECIPHAMMGVDILCQAKSGMGKTAVFVLTILHQLPENPKPVSAIILCHNRELAYQIHKEFNRFQTQLQNVRTEVIYGGVPIIDHIKMLKGLKAPDIIVGTPGRVLARV